MAEIYELRNLKGRPFKFSFVCQILMAHLQHMFGLKGKSRYNKAKWLRSYCREGRALQARIKEMVGSNIDTIAFKRTLTMSELKSWLEGASFNDRDSLSTAEAADLRFKVFRVFCILKEHRHRKPVFYRLQRWVRSALLWACIQILRSEDHMGGAWFFCDYRARNYKYNSLC